MARACTINEPNIVATMGWHAGMFPPGKSDVALSRTVSARPGRCPPRRGRRHQGERPRCPRRPDPVDDRLPAGSGRARRSSRASGTTAEDVFLDAIEGDDFVGVQVYTRMLIGPDGWAGYEDGVPVLDMGYEFYPASLGNCLRRAWDYTGGSIPLLVTENGIGTTDDEQRIDYVRQALGGVLDAVADGVDVRGYTYWSLLDNFEWALGYRPRFGIVSVDRDDVRPHGQAQRGLAGGGGGGQRSSTS